jgi:hypothetical protein
MLIALTARGESGDQQDDVERWLSHLASTVSFSASKGIGKLAPNSTAQNCANLATASTPAHNDIVQCVLLGERKTNVVVFSEFDLNFVMEKAFLNDNSQM